MKKLFTEQMKAIHTKNLNEQGNPTGGNSFMLALNNAFMDSTATIANPEDRDHNDKPYPPGTVKVYIESEKDAKTAIRMWKNTFKANYQLDMEEFEWGGDMLHFKPVAGGATDVPAGQAEEYTPQEVYEAWQEGELGDDTILIVKQR